MVQASHPLGPYNDSGLNLNACANDTHGKMCGLLKHSCNDPGGGRPSECANAPHVVPAQQSFVLQLPNSSEWMWGGDIWGSAAETDGIKSHDTQTWLPFEFNAAGMPLPLRNLKTWELPLPAAV